MPAKDDYESLQALAERLGLDDNESDRFVSSSMQRLGYKPRTDWDEPEDDGGKSGGGDFFSGKREQRQQRQVGGGGGGGRESRRSSGGGYGYE